MSVTRGGKPASRKCRFGHPHLWVQRIRHDGVYDCTRCGATDDDERPADAPAPVSYGDWLLHMAGATPRAIQGPEGGDDV
jgi:hypothetical protein